MPARRITLPFRGPQREQAFVHVTVPGPEGADQGEVEQLLGWIARAVGRRVALLREVHEGLDRAPLAEKLVSVPSADRDEGIEDAKGLTVAILRFEAC